MNKTRIFLLSLIAVVLFTACDDDFLNTQSTDLSDDLIWSDPELAEVYILNLYTSVRLADKEPSKGEGSAGITRGFHWAMFSSVTDETVYSNDDQTYIIQTGGMTPSNFGFIGSSWGRNYLGIRECNDALAKIPGLEISDEKKNELMGEVRFIRAARYFELLRGYGGAPLIGDVVTGLEDDFSSLYNRATINETVQYIVDELDYAIANLPLKSQQQIGRASSESAMGYKARTLLYAASPLFTDGAGNTNGGLNGGSTTTWQQAANAADEIIALGRFRLIDDLDADPAENYRLFFLGEDSDEDLFLRDYNATSRVFSGLEKMNAPNSMGGWAGNGPMQNFVDDFEMAATGLPIDDPSSGYDEDNPFVGRDPRFYATVVYDGGPFRGQTIDITVDAGAGQNLSRTGYFMRKFIDESSDLNDWDNTGRLTPWRYVRYAEVLLNFAEAQNEAQGPNAGGATSGLTPLQAVNMVRNRAGMPDLVGLGQSELRDRIRNERRIELFMEEHRYYDVRRWLIAESTEGATARKIVRTDTGYDFSQPVDNMGPKAFSIEHYWLPIPINDITISGGALVQNPAYGE